MNNHDDDPAGVERVLRRYRRGMYLAPVPFAAVMLALLISRLPASGRYLAWLVGILLGITLLFAVAAILAGRAELRRKESEAARLGALAFHRAETDRGIRDAEWRRWLLPLGGIVLSALAAIHPDRQSIAAAIVVNAFAWPAAGYLQFVRLPRLRRERRRFTAPA
ncbi:MAG TPA: hypothetical protein VFB32_01430 [Rudaea sp.]|nr:hypothetical protein [Rudaea sp.]